MHRRGLGTLGYLAGSPRRSAFALWGVVFALMFATSARADTPSRTSGPQVVAATSQPAPAPSATPPSATPPSATPPAGNNTPAQTPANPAPEPRVPESASEAAASKLVSASHAPETPSGPPASQQLQSVASASSAGEQSGSDPSSSLPVSSATRAPSTSTPSEEVSEEVSDVQQAVTARVTTSAPKALTDAAPAQLVRSADEAAATTVQGTADEAAATVQGTADHTIDGAARARTPAMPTADSVVAVAKAVAPSTSDQGGADAVVGSVDHVLRSAEATSDAAAPVARMAQTLADVDSTPTAAFTQARVPLVGAAVPSAAPVTEAVATVLPTTQRPVLAAAQVGGTVARVASVVADRGADRSLAGTTVPSAPAVTGDASSASGHVRTVDLQSSVTSATALDGVASAAPQRPAPAAAPRGGDANPRAAVTLVHPAAPARGANVTLLPPVGSTVLPTGSGVNAAPPQAHRHLPPATPQPEQPNGTALGFSGTASASGASGSAPGAALLILLAELGVAACVLSRLRIATERWRSTRLLLLLERPG
jgi:hypothetical protein